MGGWGVVRDCSAIPTVEFALLSIKKKYTEFFYQNPSSSSTLFSSISCKTITRNTKTKKMVKYEEIRQQRLEENKKRMEELNLPLLTQALKNSTSPKPSPVSPSSCNLCVSAKKVNTLGYLCKDPFLFSKRLTHFSLFVYGK